MEACKHFQGKSVIENISSAWAEQQTSLFISRTSFFTTDSYVVEREQGQSIRSNLKYLLLQKFSLNKQVFQAKLVKNICAHQHPNHMMTICRAHKYQNAILLYCFLTFPFMHLADSVSKVGYVKFDTQRIQIHGFLFLLILFFIHPSILQNTFVEGRETHSMNGQTITGLQI